MIYLHAKDAYESSHQYLIKKLEEVGVKHYKDSKAFIKYFGDIKNFHKSIEDYNLRKERKALIVFDDKITNMISNKKHHPVVTALFIKRRKLNNFLLFITQSYFLVPKYERLNTIHLPF